MKPRWKSLAVMHSAKLNTAHQHKYLIPLATILLDGFDFGLNFSVVGSVALCSQ